MQVLVPLLASGFGVAKLPEDPFDCGPYGDRIPKVYENQGVFPPAPTLHTARNLSDDEQLFAPDGETFMDPDAPWSSTMRIGTYGNRHNTTPYTSYSFLGFPFAQLSTFDVINPDVIESWKPSAWQYYDVSDPILGLQERTEAWMNYLDSPVSLQALTRRLEKNLNLTLPEVLVDLLEARELGELLRLAITVTSVIVDARHVLSGKLPLIQLTQRLRRELVWIQHKDFHKSLSSLLSELTQGVISVDLIAKFAVGPLMDLYDDIKHIDLPKLLAVLDGKVFTVEASSRNKDLLPQVYTNCNGYSMPDGDNQTFWEPYRSNEGFQQTEVFGHVRIAVQIKDGFTAVVDALGFLKPFSAMWQIVPLSFVIDMFYDVTSLLDRYVITSDAVTIVDAYTCMSISIVPYCFTSSVMNPQVAKLLLENYRIGIMPRAAGTPRFEQELYEYTVFGVGIRAKLKVWSVNDDASCDAIMQEVINRHLASPRLGVPTEGFGVANLFKRWPVVPIEESKLDLRYLESFGQVITVSEIATQRIVTQLSR